MNFEMKKVGHWFKANKISLNSSKTEIIIFSNVGKKKILIFE